MCGRLGLGHPLELTWIGEVVENATFGSECNSYAQIMFAITKVNSLYMQPIACGLIDIAYTMCIYLGRMVEDIVMFSGNHALKHLGPARRAQTFAAPARI